jgi:hypothetical protein
MKGILKVFKEFNKAMLEIKAERIGLIGDIASGLGSILDFFSNAPAKAITVTKQNWKAFGTMIVEAMQQILQQFKQYTTGSLKLKSERMGFIGTMIDVVQSAADLAADLPEKMDAIRKFVTIDFGSLWTTLGLALGRMFSEINKGFKFLPNPKKMERASELLGKLEALFADMVSLSENIANRAALPTTVLPYSTPTEGAVAPQVPNPSGVGYVQPQGGAQGEGAQISIVWQTYTGEPSAREKKALMHYLKPAIDAEVRRQMRTGF